jgi:hypothetical protein
VMVVVVVIGLMKGLQKCHFRERESSLIVIKLPLPLQRLYIRICVRKIPLAESTLLENQSTF